MAHSDLKGKLSAFLLAMIIVAAGVHFDVIGRGAYALEQATLDVIDDNLPTPEQVDELARVNRLVARKALAAVVSIMTETELPPGHRRFLRDLPRGPVVGQGSGVIIDAQNGYLLTNHHVVDDADDIIVELSDGRQFEGQVISTDEKSDTAVIKIEADRLFDLPLGDSEALHVGDPVMTVGNPFGFQGTVSKGIVSAKDRATSARILDYEGFIQTDAVINPGNSGGPLVNMRAEIVGLNTAMETRTGTFNGVGFAIPSSRIMKLLPTMLQGKTMVRGYLGVAMNDVRGRPEEARKLGWTQTHGVIVTNVIADSPADKAGVQPGDILAQLNGSKVRDIGYLGDEIAFTRPGDKVVLDIWRQQRLVSLETVVEAQPENFSTRGWSREPELAGLIPELGIAVEALRPRHVERYDLDQSLMPGVVITEVEPDSVAEVSSIKAGDVITAINGTEVRGLQDMAEILARTEFEDGLEIQLHDTRGARRVLVSTSN